MPRNIEYYQDYGIIAVLVYTTSNNIEFNYTLITLYDLNLDFITYIIPPYCRDINYVLKRDRFKLMLQYKNDNTKIKISFGYDITNHQRLYNTLTFIDNNNIRTNKILTAKKANDNTRIIFNDKIIVRYHFNMILFITQFEYILYSLPFELQNEIFNILYNLCVRSKLL